MSGYGQTIGYANQSSAKLRGSVKPVRRVRKKEMKLTLKQRIKNWLMDGSVEQDLIVKEEAPSLNSEGIRFEVHKASGGFVIETRYYDRKTDMHNNKIYVVTEDKDLGQEIGKIITMESMR